MHGHRVDAVLKTLELHGVGCSDGQDAAHLFLHLGTAARRGLHGLGRRARVGGLLGRRGAEKVAFQVFQQLGVAVALHGYGFYDGAAQLGREFGHINHQAARTRHIGHVECHRQWQSQAL